MGAVGMSEVLIGSITNAYLSQSIPFSNFFFGLSAVGYVRCGIGSAASAAIVARLYKWSSVKIALMQQKILMEQCCPLICPLGAKQSQY